MLVPDGGGDHLGFSHATQESMKLTLARALCVGNYFKITTIKELLVGLCAGQCNVPYQPAPSNITDEGNS